MRNEGRDIDLEQATPNVVHPGLHLDYDLDFQTRRVDDSSNPHISSAIQAHQQYSSPWEARGTQRACILGQMHQAPLAMAG